MARLKPTRPVFAAMYADCSRNGTIPPTEAMLMTRPDLLRDHRPCRHRPAHPEGPGQVDVHDQVPVLGRDLVGGNPIRRVDSGIVDQDVDATVFRQQLGDDAIDVLIPRDVQFHRLRVRPAGRIRRQPVGGGVAVDDVRAVGGQRVGDGTADALRGSRNQRDRAGQVHRHVPAHLPVHQPFSEPIRTPLTKYFCRNGYTSRIGRTAIITAAMRSDRDVIVA